MASALFTNVLWHKHRFTKYSDSNIQLENIQRTSDWLDKDNGWKIESIERRDWLTSQYGKLREGFTKEKKRWKYFRNKKGVLAQVWKIPYFFLLCNFSFLTESWLTEVRPAVTGVLISVEVSELFRSQTGALSLPVSAGRAGGAQRFPLHTEQTTLLPGHRGRPRQSGPLSLVQINKDTLLWLVEPYYAGTKAYAITTTTRGILCLSVWCFGMISGLHARKGSINGALTP